MVVEINQSFLSNGDDSARRVTRLGRDLESEDQSHQVRLLRVVVLSKLNSRVNPMVTLTTQQVTAMLKQLLGLWKDTWWLWLGFVLLTIGFSLLLGLYFLLLLPCLPIPFVYFAINRYDEDGSEKRDLGA